MSIPNHISNLLQKHNCVVVPEFGAFLKKEQAAQFGPQSNELYPPASELVFQRHKQLTDDLLMSELKEKEGLDTVEASKQIEQFVQKANQSLQTTKSFIVKDIGKLYINSNDEYVLKASSTLGYNEQSYGLPVLPTTKLNRQQKEQEQLSAFIGQKKQLSPMSVFFTAAATLLLLVLSGSLYFLHQGTPEEQALVKNSFAFVTTSPQPEENNERTVELNQHASTSTTIVESAPSTTINTIKEDEKEVIEEKSTDKIFKNSVTEEGDFHIIVGMFRQENRALIVQKQAEEKGYYSTVVKGRKYYRVSVPFSVKNHTWRSAQLALMRDVASDAWVWESRFR